MQKLLVPFVAVLTAGVLFAGPRVGGRAGYYGTTNPFTGQEADGPALGGQLILPLAGIFDLEFSGTYASSKADIVMSEFLINYVNDTYGRDYTNNPEGLQEFLGGWADPAMLNQTYEATYHDVGLASVLKLGVPLGASALKPYVGGGFGVHFTASDADAMLAAIEQQTQGSTSIDPYDHIHPSLLGVVGLSIQPPMLPISFFGEFNYSKPMGDDAGEPINAFAAGVNFGF